MPDMGYEFGIANGVPYLELHEWGTFWLPFQANSALPPDPWVHVAVTVERGDLGAPSTVSFYINGVLDDDTDRPNLTYSLENSGDLFIGRSGFWDTYFTGAIDELTMYDRVLTEAEIQEIYHAASAGKCQSNSAEVGEQDNFDNSAGPPDPIYMRSEYEAFVNRPGGNNCAYHGCQALPFDTLNPLNWEFGYTFTNLPDLDSATLEIHLRSGSGAGSGNDALGLQWIDNGDGTWNWGWYRRLSDLDAYMGGDGVFSPDEDLVVFVDMFQLPLSDGSTLDLLPMINADGYLDVRVQDDTAIDYILLRATVAPPGIPGDIDGDGDVDLNDFATFAVCHSGSAVTTPPLGCDTESFARSDLDDDGDVDLNDFATFAVNFTG
jgi:hypothetical protein